ncbi:hypothetical protein BDN72DRAFT_834263 [Pluteus cervinus]|uniref:Uncharacterized protein n=1 Tax=Pluteus cervinus TaxID=181527 RepID=A0ACD3B7M8_9AGAR|nr:hypothetical protein BDN72DRAFT_834263 [Pluteus cervinus]
MPGNKCSNCIMLQIECVHTPRVKQRISQSGYIKLLERRLAGMEELLRTRQEHPDIGTSPPPDGETPNSRASPFSGLSYPTPKAPTGKAPNVTDLDEDFAHLALSEHLGNVTTSAQDRFFGQSSGFMLAKQTMAAKLSSTGTVMNLIADRQERWALAPWEWTYATGDSRQYLYPPQDLLETLLSAYFTNVNIFFPIIHRPSFEQSVSEGLHLRDRHFGTLLLTTCALASRFVDDPRIPLEGQSELSLGWRYMSQVPPVPHGFLVKTTLYDIQYYCLAYFYYLGTGMPHASWIFVGFGIRCMQERGIHRRKPQSYKLTKEDEQWKRAFWCLVCLDRFLSSFLGRVAATQDEEFDIDYPVECDDEYWDTFVQPEGKPSSITGFVHLVKLCEILAFALRTLYATKKSKILTGIAGDQWEQRLVSELDSAMNNWFDSLPEHLRWDANRTNQNQVFHSQSASLFATYYLVQIQIHRQFIQTQSPLSAASLAICINAARCCSQISDTQLRNDNIILPLPLGLMNAFTSGLILLLNFWIGKGKLARDPSKEMKYVHLCMNVLRTCEPRWNIAGRLWDILNGLSSVTEPAAASSESSSPSEPDLVGSPRISLAHPFTNSHLQGENVAPSAPEQSQKEAFWKPEDGWNLNNLILPQMSFGQAFETDQTPPLPQTFAGSATQPTFPGPSTRQPYYGQAPVATDTNEVVNDQVVTSWLTGFYVEPWNEYLSSMMQQPRQYP